VNRRLYPRSKSDYVSWEGISDSRIRIQVRPDLTPVHQRSRRWLTALLVAMSISFGKSWDRVWNACSPQEGYSHYCYARRGVSIFVRHLLTAAKAHGSKKVFKETSAWLRRLAVDDLLVGESRPDFLAPVSVYFCGALSLKGFTAVKQKWILFQLSRFSRAGPLPEEVDVKSSLFTHLEDLTTEFKTSSRLCRKAFSFARTWSRNKKWDWARLPSSLSATFESARSKGGMLKALKDGRTAFEDTVLDLSLLEEISDIVAGVFPFRLLSDENRNCIIGGSCPEAGETCGELLWPYEPSYYPVHDIGPQEWDILYVHLMTFTHCALEVRRSHRAGILPAIRQTVIRERGEKLRMVTPVTYAVSYLSMFLNSMLLRALKSDPRVNPETEDPMEDFVSTMFTSHKGYVFRSVDMTRATDLMPLDVVSSFVEGIIAGAGFTPFLAEAFRVCTGRMMLHHRIPILQLVVRQEETSRGILMGLGTSWPILSLYNLWLWERAWTETGWRRRVGFRARQCVKTVGDDLLGYAPLGVSRAYTALLARTGGSPSVGKDLQSFHTGVLVEQFITASIRRPPNSPWVYPRTCSVRPLLPGMSVTREGWVLPPWAMGPQLTRAIEALPGRERIVRLVQRWYSAEIGRLRRNRIPPFLHREIGGGGFPCTESQLRRTYRTLDPRWTRSVRCAMSQDFSKVHLCHLSSSWSSANSGPLSDGIRKFWINAAAEAVESLDLAGTGEGKEPSAIECGERALAIVSDCQRMLVPGPVADPSLRLGDIKRRLNGAVKTLNSLVPYPKMCDTPSAMWVGLLRFIKKLKEPVHPMSLLRVVKVTGVTLGEFIAPEETFGEDSEFMDELFLLAQM